jgi:hypothetical protein
LVFLAHAAPEFYISYDSRAAEILQTKSWDAAIQRPAPYPWARPGFKNRAARTDGKKEAGTVFLLPIILKAIYTEGDPL